MGSIINDYKPIPVNFVVRKYSVGHFNYASSLFYIDTFKSDFNNTLYDLKVLYNNIAKLRSSLSSDDGYYLYRKGSQILNSFDNFIFQWNIENNGYCETLTRYVNKLQNAGDTLDDNTHKATENILKSIE